MNLKATMCILHFSTTIHSHQIFPTGHYFVHLVKNVIVQFIVKETISLQSPPPLLTAVIQNKASMTILPLPEIYVVFLKKNLRCDKTLVIFAATD